MQTHSSKVCGTCSVIFCEATAIYGVIVAIILQTKVEIIPMGPDSRRYGTDLMAGGYAILGAGLTTGFANLVCG